MALASGCALPFAGLIGCSAYPHPAWGPPRERPPVLLSHGTTDEVVPYLASQELLRSLKKSQIEVELTSFEGGHEIPRELIPRIQLALTKWFI